MRKRTTYNSEAFKKLIANYNSITAQDILDARALVKTIPIKNSDVLHNLTGFGNSNKCTLCKEAMKLKTKGNYCNACLHYLFNKIEDTPCIEHKTMFVMYSDYIDASRLLRLIKNRAKYLQSILDKYEKEQDIHIP